MDSLGSETFFGCLKLLIFYVLDMILGFQIYVMLVIKLLFIRFFCVLYLLRKN